MPDLQRAATWCLCLGLMVLLSGCFWSSGPTVPAPAPMPVVQQGQFDTESGPHAAGKKVFVASGCFRCHAIDGVRGPIGSGPMPGGPPPGPGVGGPMPPMPGGPGPMIGGKAPDLGKVGGDLAHTVDWLMAYIRNPKATKAGSKMPSFEGKIKDDDLRALAEYLASLK